MLINIKNNIDEISRVCDEIKQFCDDNNVSEEKYHDIVLILDEVVTNVINYAYPDGGEHMFSLDIQEEEGRVFIKLADSGIAFDPLGKDNPDIESALEERQIGGLGIFIVKQLSEAVEYSRIDDRNMLNIVVSVSNSGASSGEQQ
jgi:anti-sigma regulatory factor (Ser/Thr protein kinase)